MRKAWIWILVLALLLTGGCGYFRPESGGQPAPTQAPTEAPTEPPTEPSTELPTEPVAEETTEPTQESFLHSGIREDGTFDEGTLFIGDSLTYGLTNAYLIPQEKIGEARYMAMAGAAPTVYFYGPSLGKNSMFYCFYSEEFADMRMCDGVAAAGETVTAVYFMMGTNYASGVNVQLFVDIIDHILLSCPNATVYMQRVPYATSNQVDATTANKRIEEAYAQFVQREEPRVRLIDSQAAIGYNLAEDGIHLTELGQAAWYEALLAYAQENQIPQ